MKIKGFPVGMIQTNCYLLKDEVTGEIALIDPGDDAGFLLKQVETAGGTLRMILLTHGHFDHGLAIQEILKKYPELPVYIHRADYPAATQGDGTFPYKIGPLPTAVFYDEGDEVKLGSLTIHVMNTPGHSPGSVVLQVEDTLFTGDTLFAGSCGRTDFPGGDTQKMLDSLRRLAALEGDYHVLPGHEGDTRLDWERKHNPYMR